MTSLPDEPGAKEAKAKEKQAQAETKAQDGREATADYRAREAAADDNAHRLKGLRLARDAEAAADDALLRLCAALVSAKPCSLPPACCRSAEIEAE